MSQKASTKTEAKIKSLLRRNNRLFDTWSILHLITGIALGWVMSPMVAIFLMIAWEPFEIFIISPIAARFGITFGYETLRNSLSDIVFDVLGVLIGAGVLTVLIAPPMHLF